MPRTYRATINVDFTDGNTAWQQHMMRALIDAGWRYVETSALAVDTDDIGVIWQGVEVVAKISGKVTGLSALTFHIQGSDDFAGVSYQGQKTYKNALPDALSYPYPKPKGLA